MSRESASTYHFTATSSITLLGETRDSDCFVRFETSLFAHAEKIIRGGTPLGVLLSAMANIAGHPSWCWCAGATQNLSVNLVMAHNFLRRTITYCEFPLLSIARTQQIVILRVKSGLVHRAISRHHDHLAPRLARERPCTGSIFSQGVDPENVLAILHIWRCASYD